MNEELDDLGTDAAVITLVGSAFDGGRGGHDAADVLARGRQLRRRRRAAPALGGLGVVAAATALAVALTGSGGAAGSAALNVDNAAFSVHTDTATGEVTVTIRQLLDENQLKQILAKAGIRTYFASQAGSAKAPGTFMSCVWTGAAKLDNNGVLSQSRGDGKPGAITTTVIDPSRMPGGSVLAFDYFTIDKSAVVTVTLLDREPTACGGHK